MQLPSEDKPYVSKNYLLDEIVVLLGGRVAETIVFGDINSGASSDIERATEIARKMITRYGMSDELGPVMYGSSNDEVFLGRDFSSSRNYSEAIAAEIDSQIKRIITDAYKRCEEILRANMDQLETVSEYLIKHEKVDGEVFKLLMSGEFKEEPEAATEPETVAETKTETSTEE